MRDSLTIVIGGEAGQGLATVGELLARLLTKAGHNFVTFQGYHSRIRGGHNTFALKISPHPLSGPEEGADLVISLDQATDEIDGPRLRPGGLLLAVGDQPQAPEQCQALTVPYKTLAEAREQNLIALGLLASALGLSLEAASEAVVEQFKRFGPEKALAALKAAYEWAQPQFGGRYEVSPAESSKAPRLLITGNEALALGAAAGGINFCSFYPMSPATTIALSLSDWAMKAGLVVEQAEDEISAINMALGAAYAGAPSLASTSGGGFALMCEGVSLAGITETPIVIAVVQRPGPATGLPTRTEQADLNLVLYAGHGEFPRAILAPSTVTECFLMGAEAARLAEESQGPVFILSDQYLSDCTRPLPPFDIDGLGEAVNPLKIHQTNAAALQEGQVYQRYDLSSPDGCSPRLLPGSEHLVRLDSDEHTADGFITEDLGIRIKMQEKRQKKLEVYKRQVHKPQYFGDDNPETLLVSWGSTLGATFDALEAIRKQARKAALLHFSQLYPLKPEDWLEKLKAAQQVIFVEGNSEGQFAQLVRRESGFAPQKKILRYDGLPLTAQYILDRLEVK